MMLSNVPNFLTQGAVVSLLEDLTVCMRGAFDFFYCPWDPHQDKNLGYAILNFFSRSVAAEFERQWANEPLLPRTHGSKRLRIVPAALQGRAANLRHFSGFTLAHHCDPRFRPLVRAAPNEALRPMALSEELVQEAGFKPGTSPEEACEDDAYYVTQGNEHLREHVELRGNDTSMYSDPPELRPTPPQARQEAQLMQQAPQHGRFAGGMVIPTQSQFMMMMPSKQDLQGSANAQQGRDDMSMQQCWLVMPPGGPSVASSMGTAGMPSLSSGEFGSGFPVPGPFYPGTMANPFMASNAANGTSGSGVYSD